MSNSKKYIPSKKTALRGVVVLAGLALIGVGSVGVYRWFVATRLEPVDVPKAVAQQTVTETTDEPDESPINPESYEVPADQPRQISIAARNIQGFIQKVGIDQKNAIATPGNINLAGWYINSVLPGELGVSLIDGHVRGKYNDGIFKQLHTVQPGDAITVEYGDRTVRQFEAVSIHEYTIDETTQKQFDQIPGIDKQLTLITCGGAFIKETNSYEKRIVVIAKGV